MRPGGSFTKENDVQHILRAARDLLGIINQELGEGGVTPDVPEPVLAVAPCDILYMRTTR